MNKIKAFSRWANTPTGHKVFFRWLFWLGFLALSIIGVTERVYGETVYGYTSEGACINDIESDSLRGYDKTYSNELRLIAEGTHDIYRIAGNSQVCFEVPTDAKHLAEASSSVNIVGASGAVFAVVTVTGSAIAQATSSALKAGAAIATWLGWEALAARLDLPYPSIIKLIDSTANDVTYTTLSDPCSLMVGPERAEGAVEHCRTQFPVRTSLPATERSINYIKPTSDLIPPNDSDRTGSHKDCSQDSAASNYCGDPPNVPTFPTPDISRPPSVRPQPASYWGANATFSASGQYLVVSSDTYSDYYVRRNTAGSYSWAYSTSGSWSTISSSYIDLTLAAQLAAYFG